MSAARLLAALFALLVLGAPARAETKLEVTTAPVTSEVALGAEISVAVTVKNAGAEKAELPELVFDARSVSFELVCEGGVPAWDARFQLGLPTNSMERDPLFALKRSTLEPGASWTQTFTIPALAAGSWQITAIYGGATNPEPRFLSQLSEAKRLTLIRDATPRTVKVLPGPNGETRLVAKVTTNLGSFTLRFFPKDALATGLNFVRIAQRGLYDGTRVFRNSSDLEILQGGSYDGNARFEWSIPREQRVRHAPLRVAMARTTDANSAGQQFYVAYGDRCRALDRADGYAVFAEVVKGKDVIETMASARSGARGPGSEMPTTAITIESVKVQLEPKE